MVRVKFTIHYAEFELSGDLDQVAEDMRRLRRALLVAEREAADSFAWADYLPPTDRAEPQSSVPAR